MVKGLERPLKRRSKNLFKKDLIKISGGYVDNSTNLSDSIGALSGLCQHWCPGASSLTNSLRSGREAAASTTGVL